MTPDDLAAMIARDRAAGDGISVLDVLVWQDRHLLILEVQRLQSLTRGDHEHP